MCVCASLRAGALHWITHPYVHELKFDAATQSFEARMTTLLGRARCAGRVRFTCGRT